MPIHTGEAIKAAATILSWWLQRRGGAEATEESQHVKAVRSYLSEFSGARFVSLVEEDAGMGHTKWVERYPDRPIVSRSGWRRAAGEGAEEYLLDKDGWAKLCQTAGSDPVEVAKTLKAVGHLAQGDGKNLTKTVRLPNVGKIRVYVIQASIFATEDAEPAGGRT